MKTLQTLTVALALLAFGVVVAMAQPGPGPDRGAPKYDPSTETTVTGTVEAIEHVDSPMGWKGVHLSVRVGEETHSVHLGPQWFVEEESGWLFEAGDEIEVIASRVKCRGEDALLARRVTRRDETLTLRDEAGRPAWSARKRRG